jgi:tetratricopeptide (TPR) repeat protein
MKRPIEIVALLAIVAVVVGLSREKTEYPVVTTSPAIAAAATRTRAAATSPPSADVAIPGPGQTTQATGHWKALYDEAQAMLAQGDNDKAETRLIAALKLAPMAGRDALHETLDDLGLVCYRLGQYQRAADYQERAVKAASALPSPDSAALVGLYETRFALALSSLDRRDDALAALRRARDSYKQAYPAGSPAYSEAMNSLAAQHRSLGDNDGAASNIEEL